MHRRLQKEEESINPLRNRKLLAKAVGGNDYFKEVIIEKRHLYQEEWKRDQKC